MTQVAGRRRLPPRCATYFTLASRPQVLIAGGVVVMGLDGVVFAADIAKDVDANDNGERSSAVEPRCVDHG